jgi:hypothetical protein
MIFQIVVLCYVALTCCQAGINWRKGRIKRRFFGLLLATHLPLIPITLQPEITTTLAHSAGIGRGADFILYCAILVMARCLLALYQWHNRLESQLTQLVRHLALVEARQS